MRRDTQQAQQARTDAELLALDLACYPELSEQEGRRLFDLLKGVSIANKPLKECSAAELLHLRKLAGAVGAASGGCPDDIAV